MQTKKIEKKCRSKENVNLKLINLFLYPTLNLFDLF